MQIRTHMIAIYPEGRFRMLSAYGHQREMRQAELDREQLFVGKAV